MSIRFALLPILVFGCRQVPTPPAVPFPEVGVYIEIRNGRPEDATVYSFHGGHRELVGFVPGGKSGHFHLDWERDATTYFEFDAVRRRNCRTRRIAVRPGESVYVWMEYRPRVQDDGVERSCDVRRVR